MKSTARFLGVGRCRCQRSAIALGLLFCSPAKGLMKALIVAVTTAMLRQAAAGAEAPTWSARPVGCIDIRSLWDLIEAQDNHDVSRAAKLMNSSCRSLEGLRYLVESERNGVSRMRIFPRGTTGRLRPWCTRPMRCCSPKKNCICRIFRKRANTSRSLEMNRHNEAH